MRKWAGWILLVVVIGLTAYEVRQFMATRPQSVNSTPASTSTAATSDLRFNQRSPHSAPAEIARRLSRTIQALGDDYDLAQRPFKAFIPADIKPSNPCGVVVYLGYKDSVDVPSWSTQLTNAHLIFITPVCHSGPQYPPAVPDWQTLGLAFDAVASLQKTYPIDDQRLYLMTTSPGSLELELAAADVFTGFVDIIDWSYFKPLTLTSTTAYPAGFPPPLPDLELAAKSRPFFLIDKTDDSQSAFKLKVAQMKRDGFLRVASTELSVINDLHYPALNPRWFEEKVLPFLDGRSGATLPD